jgi:hypothetical protein
MEKLESMQKFDSASYVNDLEKNFREIKDEIENLAGIRKNEERLNHFLDSLQDYRTKNCKVKEMLRTKIHARDGRFVASTSPILVREINNDAGRISTRTITRGNTQAK